MAMMMRVFLEDVDLSCITSVIIELWFFLFDSNEDDGNDECDDYECEEDGGHAGSFGVVEVTQLVGALFAEDTGFDDLHVADEGVGCFLPEGFEGIASITSVRVTVSAVYMFAGIFHFLSNNRMRTMAAMPMRSMLLDVCWVCDPD